ncbi:Uncharacterised protein [Chromobacterium violaceum]|uniref:Transposase n=1 Tax=Chromobacterium violaceum (strain ATCC 12472 / DSM 30191 / JCM 1249 / CCUG 213 / NBRC 12614 / NCIMB 9131 / NCTC 9757 / MK) TaxID=243365 RepID=Q7NU98_CHRVO|nr:conserved hypothetical protein [Chromobacterium violaceum ATCC 12472]SUX35997.1 Uncharacterised protein [Chromobacterium violaceum]
MKQSKFAEEQIAFGWRQTESGITITEVCRKMGASEATFWGAGADTAAEQTFC